MVENFQRIFQGPMEKALDQMENAFIKVETKRRKERSEQKLKTIEEKKED